MVAIYRYLKRDNDKILEFHVKSSSYYEISAALQ